MRVRFALAFLSVVAFAAVAKTPLDRCLASVEGPGPGECWSREARRLELEQKGLAAELVKQWTECKFNSVGYQPTQAVRELRLAQEHWGEFVKHECNYAEHTFGQGTGAGYAHVQCQAKLHRDRAKALRTKLQELQSAKQMLGVEPGAISCPAAR
jgi:hypothetical protein